MVPKDEDARKFAISACKPFKNWPTDGSQFPYLGVLQEDDTVESIVRRLHENAINLGIGLGREQKEKEIKNVLGIFVK